MTADGSSVPLVGTEFVSTSIFTKFLGEVDLTAVHVINRVPSSLISSMSPFQKLYGCVPDYSL